MSETRTNWIESNDPPQQVGSYWITLEFEGERWVRGPVGIWEICPGRGCWPVNAIAYLKIDEPEPFRAVEEV